MKPQKKALRDQYCVGYCPTIMLTGKRKRSYPTKSAAKRALKSANNHSADRSPGKRRQTMVYLCGCGAWHTSSLGSH